MNSYPMIYVKHKFFINMHETRFDLNKRAEKGIFLIKGNLFCYQSNVTLLIQHANLIYVHHTKKKERTLSV